MVVDWSLSVVEIQTILRRFRILNWVFFFWVYKFRVFCRCCGCRLPLEFLRFFLSSPILKDEVQGLFNLCFHSNRCAYDARKHCHHGGWQFAQTNREQAQRGKLQITHLASFLGSTYMQYLCFFSATYIVLCSVMQWQIIEWVFFPGNSIQC